MHERLVPEPPKARAVSRVLRREDHLEGYHATNWTADLADMIAAPEDAISLEAKGYLMRLKRGALRPNPKAPERVSVFLTRKQWQSFCRLRSAVLRHRDALRYRNPCLPPHRNPTEDGYAL
jgi:hypothetical protein